MSAEEEDGADRPHDPTPRKLEEARKKGQIPRSQDVNTAAGYAGVLAALLVAGGWSLDRLGSVGRAFLDHPDRLAAQFFGGASAPVGGLIGSLGIAVAPWFLLPALAVVLVIVVQRGFVVTGENLAPRLSRLSPIAAAKQKFGRNGLFEFAKSTVKLAVVGLVLVVFLDRRAEEILGLMRLSPGQSAVALGGLLRDFLLVVLVITAIIAALDLLWQHFEHTQRNRMSLKELRDEAKESEGDPHLRQARRRRAIDIATNRMLAEVPKADVVIVNPTHYAVALKWSRKRGAAPVCVAKGVDEIAARIRESAAEAGVPIHRDPPTARAIHATVDLGREIRAEHYRAVAAAIRFAERMRSRARGRAQGRRPVKGPVSHDAQSRGRH